MSLRYIFARKTASNFRPVVLVTGCSSGIGLALAELLEREPHYRVVLTARAESLAVLRERFQESDRLWIRALDVTKPLERKRLIKEISDSWLGVNILINNAGVSYRAVVEHMSEKDEYDQFAVNYFGPTGLIREVLPYMRSLGRGKIVNVSSVSGMLAMPTMGSYSASKHALEGLSEALWYELKPLGISISLIQPGFVRSRSFQKVKYSAKSMPLSAPEQRGEKVYDDYYLSMTPFIERLMNLSLTTPRSVARKILAAVRTQEPPLWIPAGLDAVFFYYLRRLLPRKLLLPFLFMVLPRSRDWAKSYSRRRR